MVDLDAPLKLQERTTLGKGLNGLRQEGLVPAVVHNHGQDSMHVMAPELELERIYEAAGKHHPLNLEIGDQKFLVLIKDAHFNPVKRRLQHVVFQAIRRDEKVEAEVPIHLEGEIPAEKVGLMVLHQLDAVEIEALPANLPDELVADASKLAELHDKIIVADLVVPEGVTILTDPEHPIATVVETKAMISEDDLAAEAAAAEVAEGEEAAEGTEAAEPAEGTDESKENE
ncbi:MAG TPA: 50S ribosomal protein L25 [Candidatus Saccharimonadales bacterium]|nr:50S ribosomal protein L25 [Candidatus Saccharimonadales bacterium]